jgi:tRNA threonylcarbamoyladenosine biosynthesis protein TsaB
MELILAVDTATAYASVALWRPYQVLAEQTWLSRGNHTVELMPTIVEMMAREGVQPKELTGLAVTKGPGSFTGMRIGISLVKGMALALGLPVAAIPTLEVIAHGQSCRFLPLRAVLQAGRGRLCWADFRWERGAWRQVGGLQLGRLPELVAGIERRTLFAGELGEQEVAYIQESLGPAAVIASPAEGLRRAAYLAEIAYRRLKRKQAEELTFSPTYLMPGAEPVE